MFRTVSDGIWLTRMEDGLAVCWATTCACSKCSSTWAAMSSSSHGWETSLRLRQMPGVADSSLVVVVTAHGRETLAQRVAQEQALLNGFLVKPVTASMLFDAWPMHASRWPTPHFSTGRWSPAPSGSPACVCWWSKTT